MTNASRSGTGSPRASLRAVRISSSQFRSSAPLLPPPAGSRAVVERADGGGSACGLARPAPCTRCARCAAPRRSSSSTAVPPARARVHRQERRLGGILGVLATAQQMPGVAEHGVTVAAGRTVPWHDPGPAAEQSWRPAPGGHRRRGGYWTLGSGEPFCHTLVVADRNHARRWGHRRLSSPPPSPGATLLSVSYCRRGASRVGWPPARGARGVPPRLDLVADDHAGRAEARPE